MRQYIEALKNSEPDTEPKCPGFADVGFFAETDDPHSGVGPTSNSPLARNRFRPESPVLNLRNDHLLKKRARW
jgi:hypothetical protein